MAIFASPNRYFTESSRWVPLITNAIMAQSASVSLLPATMTAKVQGSLAAKEVAQDTVKRILPTTTLNWPTL